MHPAFYAPINEDPAREELRHQVMFGSNNPRFEQIRMAQAIRELGFRESTLELIMGGNAIEFLGGLD